MEIEPERIRGTRYIVSEVRIGDYWDGGQAVELKFSEQTSDKARYATTVVIDRATAARLINQLRRALDEDYMRSINNRPDGYDCGVSDCRDPHPSAEKEM